DLRHRGPEIISCPTCGRCEIDLFGLVEKVEKALYLLTTEHTEYSYSLEIIKSFYDMGDERKSALFQLLDAMNPKRIETILNQIFAVMDTPEWLITMREDFMRLRKMKVSGQKAAAMKNLNDSFEDYFSKIFNFQYFNTRLCNYQNTSVKLLKYIAEKEGVHPSEHWWSFEDRLNSPDRIILSLEHFKMPSIPLVYIEIAFSKGLIGNIEKVLAAKRNVIDIAKADTVIFYSVNTTFSGLAGIGMGRKMIILAKKFINEKYPQISRFATLSPVPKFRAYLDTVLKNEGHEFLLKQKSIDENAKHCFFTDNEALAIRQELVKSNPQAEKYRLSDLLTSVLCVEQWYKNPVFKANLKHPITNLTLYYMKNEKRTDRKTLKRLLTAFDPVENFHLSNGAYLGAINYCGNTSERGIKESYGMMVNYIYNGKKMDSNKLHYSDGEILIKI
ncbi:hypothetical protein FP828_07830, partial [bacterium]|nr:hypothetical protein [bacterium]